MKITWIILCAMLLSGTGAFGQDATESAAEPEVTLEFNLRSGPDRVLLAKNRANALAASEFWLSNQNDNFEERVESAVNPFKFKVEVPVEPEETDTDPEDGNQVPVRRNYADAEVLAGAAEALQPQITGTLIMGEKRLLLRGSSDRPIRVGYTFNVRIPAGSENIFTIEIVDIQQKSFTLRLNDSQVVVPIGEMPTSGGISTDG